METQHKIFRSLRGVALATALILLVPLVAMQFTNEVVWEATDFIIMGALLFCTGLAYKWIALSAPNIIYRAASGLAVVTLLFMIWANLAVGIIGSGPNTANLMYIGVVAVTIIGTILSHLRPRGMERTMYATAFALVLVAIIALLANMHQYLGSSVAEIVGVNAFFAAPCAVSGLLFRYAARNTHEQIQKAEG